MEDRTIHFEAENHGTIWLFRPLTAEAQAWVDEKIDTAAGFFADAVVVEHRYIGAIVEGAAADGLRVRVLG